VNIRHAGVDVLPELELLRALADLDCTDFARPVVDVLEQVTVDGLEVSKIKLSQRDTLRDALRDQRPLCLVDDSSVLDAETIFEGSCARVDVWIV